MRLIDADALKSYIDCGHLRPPTEVCFSELDVCNMIDKAPTVSADRPSGEWIRKVKEYNDCDGHRAYYWYECSECGAKPPKDQWKNEWHSPYCPSCGAYMKGGAE